MVLMDEPQRLHNLSLDVSHCHCWLLLLDSVIRDEGLSSRRRRFEAPVVKAAQTPYKQPTNRRTQQHQLQRQPQLVLDSKAVEIGI